MKYLAVSQRLLRSIQRRIKSANIAIGAGVAGAFYLPLSNAQNVSAEFIAGTSTIDSILTVLPGVLIAGLALIFAIRERNRAKAYLRELEQTASTARYAQQDTMIYRSAADCGAVGLWQTDAVGKTLYANTAMCELLGVDDSAMLQDSDARLLLKPLGAVADGARREPTDPYAATLHNRRSGIEQRVLIFEQQLNHRDAAGPIILRTVINPALLPCRLLDKRGDHLTIAA